MKILSLLIVIFLPHFLLASSSGDLSPEFLDSKQLYETTLHKNQKKPEKRIEALQKLASIKSVLIPDLFYISTEYKKWGPPYYKEYAGILRKISVHPQANTLKISQLLNISKEFKSLGEEYKEYRSEILKKIYLHPKAKAANQDNVVKKLKEIGYAELAQELEKMTAELASTQKLKKMIAELEQKEKEEEEKEYCIIKTQDTVISQEEHDISKTKETSKKSWFFGWTS